MTNIRKVSPAEIENLSFSIIEQEFQEQTGIAVADLDRRVFQVIRRVIHATGDFGFARSLIFQEFSIDSAVSAIRAGKDIYIDVMMGASGISRTLLSAFGGTVRCFLNDPDVAARAGKENKTRSEIALAKLSGDEVGILAVGNAPTALLAAMEMIDRGRLEPALVIGVPVGFVNAAEAKDILATRGYPFITCLGRKGGTPVAVAIVNALLRIAGESDNGS